MKIGEAIVVARKKNDISQNKLAKLVNLNRGYIYKLETNQTNPTLKTIEKIAEAIGIRVSDLIKIAEQMQDSEYDNLIQPFHIE